MLRWCLNNASGDSGLSKCNKYYRLLIDAFLVLLKGEDSLGDLKLSTNLHARQAIWICNILWFWRLPFGIRSIHVVSFFCNNVLYMNSFAEKFVTNYLLKLFYFPLISFDEMLFDFRFNSEVYVLVYLF